MHWKYRFTTHSQLLAPSVKDEYKGAAVVKYLCLEGPRLRRNCKFCREKCSIYKALRKYILPFDYTYWNRITAVEFMSHIMPRVFGALEAM